jgi:hypothetical protein
MQGWYANYTTLLEDNTFDINCDGTVMVVFFFIVFVRVSIHRIMFNTQGCSNETCSHIWVRQLHQIHGDALVPAAAPGVLCRGYPLTGVSAGSLPQCLYSFAKNNP